MEKDFYEITSSTCALIALEGERTEIIEQDKKFVVNKLPLEIISESCEYYGSTFEGRISGSKKQLGMCYKLPITIEGSNELIFFPTMSPGNEECCWIAVKNIRNYKAIDNNVIITFNGNNIHQFPISLESFENQVFRATKLMLITRNRRNIEK